jgi:hypothetical protein
MFSKVLMKERSGSIESEDLPEKLISSTFKGETAFLMLPDNDISTSNRLRLYFDFLRYIFMKYIADVLSIYLYQ